MNHCLKYAVWLIAQHYTRRPPLIREARRVRHRLNASYGIFDGVLLDHSRRFLAEPIVTGQHDLPSVRAYYRDALDVALAIIRQQGLLLEDESGPRLRLPSIVLNMSELFEAYIRKALQLHAATNGWSWHVLDGNSDGSRPLYKGQASPAATPDIVVEGQGVQPLILEVKYIPVEGKSPREAVNQAVTYAACYHANRAVLIHPCGGAQVSGMRKLGAVGDVEVFQYRFDLNASDLSTEAANFARAIEEIVIAEPSE